MDLARALAGREFYDCATCARNPGLRVGLGCDGRPPLQYWRRNLITDEPLAECPMRTMRRAEPGVLRAFERYRMEYYPLYKAGHLLVPGGVAYQPAIYLDAMRMLETADRAVQAKYDELGREGGE